MRHKIVVIQRFLGMPGIEAAIVTMDGMGISAVAQ
jgi:hypothetical protein